MNNDKTRIIGVCVLVVILVFIFTNSAKVIKDTTDIFVVENRFFIF